MPIQTGLPPQPNIPVAAPPDRAAPAADDIATRELRELAGKLEAGFLSEMLKAAGFGAPRESFGGGAGEDQFASFLREAQAKEMVRAGGIGLSEMLFNSLKESGR